MAWRKKMGYTPETMRKIQKAASHPELLSMKVVDAMEHFNISHAGITEARRRAVTAQPSASLKKALAEKDRTRLFNKLLRVESSYPFIHERLVKARNIAAVSNRYKITRQRAHQMLQQFEKYANEQGMTLNSLLDEIRDSA
jgi:hypothetical protein